MSETFKELFSESLSTVNMTPGNVVTGVVMDVDEEWVTVHAGLKSEGVIPRSQFNDSAGRCELSPGDEVQVALEAVDDGLGNTRLSREKARRMEIWDMLQQAYENEGEVRGKVVGGVKGGFMVDIDCVRCFLPGSLADSRPVHETEDLNGKEMDFRIIRMEPARNNVVLSRRAVLEAQSSEERKKLLDSLTEGRTVRGTVRNMTNYGAFVDIGGIDGLLHVTDMSWKRVTRPDDVVQIGDELELKILKFDRENERISLGLKQLQHDPWEQLAERYPTGTRIQVRVTKTAEYGCFAELEEGIEGLIHITEMSWLQPPTLAEVGEELEVMVLEVSPERHRISLSAKQCTENPWMSFASRHTQGERISGVIKSITNFGLFVELEGGVTGLVHVSDLSWEESENHEAVLRNYKKGESLEVLILSMDAENERIGLGVRQLNDPLSSYTADHPEGSVVRGKITKVLSRSATVELAEGVVGLLRGSEVSRERIEDVRTVLENGQEVEAQILNVDHKLRRVILSICAMQEKEERDAMQSYQERRDSDAGGSGPRLGDLMSSESDEEKGEEE